VSEGAAAFWSGSSSPLDCSSSCLDKSFAALDDSAFFLAASASSF